MATSTQSCTSPRPLIKQGRNYNIHNKQLTAINVAFKHWHHYLERSGTPIDIVTDHYNLQYLSIMKVLTQHQVQISEFLSQFNLIFCFHPGKLGAKPDALTHHWDIYPREGSSNYARINPQNLQPVSPMTNWHHP